MKRVLGIVLALAMIFSLAACGSTPAEDTKEKNRDVVIGTDMTNLTTLDVWDSDYNCVFEVSDAIFDRLFDKNIETLELETNLLAEWPTISEDGLVYTFKLKEDVKWSDGKPLTAKDVEFTLNYFYGADTASGNTWVSEAILGCDEMMAGESDYLEGFKLIDDYNFQITLKEPYSAFLATLATSMMPILPAHARPDAGDAWGTTVMPIGSGPYKVESFEAGVNLVLVPNENYRGTKPDLDHLIIKNMDNATAMMEYEAGNIDYFTLATDQVEDAKARLSDNFHQRMVVSGVRIGLNMSMKPLDDVRVRKAFALAVDLDAIINGYYKGNVAPLNGVIPYGIPGNDNSLEQTPYDIEEAKKLLADAGYPDGITLDVAIKENQDDFAFIFQLIQEQAAAAGITLNITKMDSSAYSETRQNGQIMVTMTQIAADFIDSHQYVYNQFNSVVSDRRSICLHDDWFDQRSTEARYVTGDENAAIAKELDYYLCKELYATIPICQDINAYVCSDRVSNLFLKGDNLINFAGVSVK